MYYTLVLYTWSQSDMLAPEWFGFLRPLAMCRNMFTLSLHTAVSRRTTQSWKPVRVNRFVRLTDNCVYHILPHPEARPSPSVAPPPPPPAPEPPTTPPPACCWKAVAVMAAWQPSPEPSLGSSSSSSSMDPKRTCFATILDCTCMAGGAACAPFF